MEESGDDHERHLAHGGPSVPVPRDADQDQAIANIHRRFPDAEISVTYPRPMA
jgi:hypothetical protein